jgi:lipopolysaccharide export system protein LptA
MHNPVKFLFIFCLALFSTGSLSHPVALKSSEPITIQADNASVEQLHRQAIYTGNVIMTQGLHQLRADTLTIKKDLQGRFSVITAVGNPASFTGKRANDPEPLIATGKTIYYYPDKQLVVLEGLATLEHQKDKFEGPTLSYNLDKQVISATSQSQDRPTITLHPRG